jgi:hypothetical protein
MLKALRIEALAALISTAASTSQDTQRPTNVLTRSIQRDRVSKADKVAPFSFLGRDNRPAGKPDPGRGKTWLL